MINLCYQQEKTFILSNTWKWMCNKVVTWLPLLNITCHKEGVNIWLAIAENYFALRRKLKTQMRFSFCPPSCSLRLCLSSEAHCKGLLVSGLPSFSTFFYALHSLFSVSWCYCSTERKRHAHWEPLAVAQQAPHRRLHPSYPVCGTISHPVVQRVTGYPAACMHTHVLNSLKVNILHYCWRKYFMPHCPCLPLPACIFLTRVHTHHGSSGSSQRHANARRTGWSMLWLKTIAMQFSYTHTLFLRKMWPKDCQLEINLIPFFSYAAHL